MTPLPAYAEFEDVMGQTEYLSELDKQGMASYYGSPVPGGGKPDLTGTWTELTPKVTTKPSGVSARVDGRLNITNLGASDAGKFAVEIYLSADSTFDTGDLLLKKISMSTLLINKNVSKRVKAKLPKGTLPAGNYVIAVIDAKAAVSEATENNNIAVFGPL